jgi:hypothetical protein
MNIQQLHNLLSPIGNMSLVTSVLENGLSPESNKSFVIINRIIVEPLKTAAFNICITWGKAKV